MHVEKLVGNEDRLFDHRGDDRDGADQKLFVVDRFCAFGVNRRAGRACLEADLEIAAEERPADAAQNLVALKHALDTSFDVRRDRDYAVGFGGLVDAVLRDQFAAFIEAAGFDAFRPCVQILLCGAKLFQSHCFVPFFVEIVRGDARAVGDELAHFCALLFGSLAVLFRRFAPLELFVDRADLRLNGVQICALILDRRGKHAAALDQLFIGFLFEFVHLFASRRILILCFCRARFSAAISLRTSSRTPSQ